MKTPTISCDSSLTDLPIPSGTETAKSVKKKRRHTASHSHKEDSKDPLPNDGQRDSQSYPDNSEDQDQVKAVKTASGSQHANHEVKRNSGSEKTKVVNESRRDSKVSKSSLGSSHHATRNSIGDKQDDEKVEDQPPKTHDNLPFETSVALCC